MTELPEHFTRAELECRCGCGAMNLKPQLLKGLDRLRKAYGAPLVITSGYRCNNYNQKIKGSKNSQHCQGLAIDIGITESLKRYEIVRLAYALGFKGIGVDRAFIHLDMRDGDPVLYQYPIK
jgi:zinc D-Ala-D-Ala carboxypeptidase